MRLSVILAAFLLAGSLSAGAAERVIFHIRLGQASDKPVSGRLLVFAEPLAQAQAAAEGKPLTEVSVDEFHPGSVAIAAQEITDLQPGTAYDLDADVTAFPRPFSQLASGRYAVQAVLDQNHTYNYSGR